MTPSNARATAARWSGLLLAALIVSCGRNAEGDPPGAAPTEGVKPAKQVVGFATSGSLGSPFEYVHPGDRKKPMKTDKVLWHLEGDGKDKGGVVVERAKAKPGWVKVGKCLALSDEIIVVGETPHDSCAVDRLTRRKYKGEYVCFELPARKSGPFTGNRHVIVRRPIEQKK